MALSSARQDSKVDPDKGVYVEMEGIMEVRYTSEDIDFQDEPEDFFYFQQRVREIPDDFCHKDRETTQQAFFYCLVCNCDLKSLRPLRDHVTGNKHIRKACEKKRQVLGLPQEPQNAPRKKEKKKERPRVDVGLTLKQRLEESGEPAIGLEYITEYLNPNKSSDHPMYTCSLEGCKSAWGTSDDIFNHCIKPKHHKNFFKKQNPEDSRIAGLSSADILMKAAEYEEEHGGSEERDYTVIRVVRNYEEYIELRDRPDDWSEKKAQLGLVGSNCNPNMEPLGKRGQGGWRGDKRNVKEESMFDEEAWAGWEPPSKKKAVEDWKYNMRNGVKDVTDMVDDFNGMKGDSKYEEINYYKDMYGKLLSLFDNDVDDEGTEMKDSIMAFKNELAAAGSSLVEKVEREDRAMKSVSKLMAELEEEIEKYSSERSTKKYKNIQSRLTQITKEMKVLVVTSPANISLKEKYNARLAQLWTDFESRSDSLVEVLEQQMGTTVGTSGKSNSQRNHDLRSEAVELYKKEIFAFVETALQQYREKFEDDRELSTFAMWVVENKVLGMEINVFIKRGAPWKDFHVTSKTRDSVEAYLKTKMKKYTVGEVYKRQK